MFLYFLLEMQVFMMIWVSLKKFLNWVFYIIRLLGWSMFMSYLNLSIVFFDRALLVNCKQGKYFEFCYVGNIFIYLIKKFMYRYKCIFIILYRRNLVFIFVYLKVYDFCFYIFFFKFKVVLIIKIVWCNVLLWKLWCFLY